MRNPFATQLKNTVEKLREGIAPSRTIGIYVIKDVNANEYNTPFFQPTPQHAIRVFKTEVNRAGEQNLLYLYPQDFELHYLGEFHLGTAELKPTNELLLTGVAVKNEEK